MALLHSPFAISPSVMPALTVPLSHLPAMLHPGRLPLQAPPRRVSAAVCCTITSPAAAPPATAWPIQLAVAVRAGRGSGRCRLSADSRRRCATAAPTQQRRQQQRAATLGAFQDDGGSSDAAANPAAAQEDRRQLWRAAIKLPMYSVGVVPVLVGAAAAFFEHGVAPWGRVAGLFVGAVCVIAWLNLSNDAFDASTGVDATKPESVVNLTGNRTAVLLLSKAFLAAGVGLLGASITAAHDGRVAAMLGAAICCGYVYQGPPFRLSYKGLGEPLCFVAFGPLATTAFYLACSAHGTGSAAAAAALAGTSLPAPSALVALLSAIVGVTTTVILFCSHWHQIAGDTSAGKRSPLVRLGTHRACKVLLAATASPYLGALAGAAAGVLPLPVLLALTASLPAAKALLDFAWANHTVAAQIAPLKRFGVKWHVAVGAALTASLVACRALAL